MAMGALMNTNSLLLALALASALVIAATGYAAGDNHGKQMYLR